MSAETVAETTRSNEPVPRRSESPPRRSETEPRRRAWVYALIAVLVVVSFGYLSLVESEDNLANRDFYRVLYEASETFNENLEQLDRRYEWQQSPSAIRSVFPSYSLVTGEKCSTQTEATKNATQIKDERNTGQIKDGNNTVQISGEKKQELLKDSDRRADRIYRYQLNAQALEICQLNPQVAKNIDAWEIAARLDLTDTLPQPKQGFSLYLFADNAGKVITTAGGEKTISIVELAGINETMLEKKRPFRFSIKEQQGTNGRQGEAPVPSYGSHVDMKLSYGEFRIFIFPFKLQNQIGKKSCVENGGHCTIDELYLVGLLPKEKLAIRGSGHWSISLLMVTLVSLLFLWTLMRVYLLPKSQSITPAYRNFTTLSGYAFYIVVIALVLAFMQKAVLQKSKDAAAVSYAETLSAQLEEELLEVFGGLNNYRHVYQKLIGELNASAKAESLPDMITLPLASVDGVPCGEEPEGLLPKYAWSPDKVYKLDVQCSDPQGSRIQRYTVELDEETKEILQKAYHANAEGSDMVSFMAGNLKISREKPDDDASKPIFSSYVSPGKASHLPSNIFSIFAFNGDANIILPSIHYQERNFAPKTANLSHRDYYKKVRDSNGWNLQLCEPPDGGRDRQCTQFDNVFIQRLLNINDGTRGTTISMPMFDRKRKDQVMENNEGLAAYTMGADVIIPSLSVASPAPYDFTYMVVDRNNGDVLFHSDDSRTLVENLFHSGNKKSSLGQRIKAALDRNPELGKIIKGNYHGQAGRFALIPTPVEAWTIVVFYPNDSLESFMTNQFLFISVSFAVALLLLVGLLIVCRQFLCTDTLKSKLCIPTEINGRRLVLSGSILLSATYSLHSIGALLDLTKDFPGTGRMVPFVMPGPGWSLLMPVIGLTILMPLLFRACAVRFRDIETEKRSEKRRKGLVRVVIAVVVLTALALHLRYLHHAASMPLKGLAHYYQQVKCNQLNHERQEIIRMGLSRYPNSITQQGINPLTLLPIDDDLKSELQGGEKECNSQIEPDDYPKLSTLVGATYLWQWINTYLMKADLREPSQPISEFKPAFWPLFGSCALLLAIVVGWTKFNGRVLWKRFYCSDRFLKHIETLTKLESAIPQDQRIEKLTIECDTIKLNGIGLALLLRTASMQVANSESRMANKLLPGFGELYQLSPYLQKLGAGNSMLPNLKLNMKQEQDNKLFDVQIWDIETCLESVEYRQSLLDLIMEIKSLTLAEQLNSFTIFTGFHSLQRVKMKDPLSMEEGPSLKHAEYLSWAECLMDFNVKVPADFKQGLDKKLLKEEIDCFPELHFLSNDKRELDATAPPKDRIWKPHEEDDTESKWNTINYILLLAEAVYRFKWESCSNAEKLALFNLAKRRRLNPANTQMIEHLALNGLIKVVGGHLEIVNRSFTHFVLNAETTDTLNRMVRRSQEGIWKSYRLPLGFLVVLIIGGIALTSGESIYIIAASVAGVLTTIAGVANSAHLLRGQIKA